MAFIINKNASICRNGGVFGSKPGVLGCWPEAGYREFTLVASKDARNAVAKHQSSQPDHRSSRQEVPADITLNIQALANHAAQILHRIVELAALFGGPCFENFRWQTCGCHTCDLASFCNQT